MEGNALLDLINRLRGAFIGRDEWFYATPFTYTATAAFNGATWYTAIPYGNLVANGHYYVHIFVDALGAGEPYFMSAGFVFCPVSTNGTGTDSAFSPLTSTHTGTTGAGLSIRATPAVGNVCAGMEFRTNTNCPSGSTVTVRAYRLR